MANEKEYLSESDLRRFVADGQYISNPPIEGIDRKRDWIIRCFGFISNGVIASFMYKYLLTDLTAYNLEIRNRHVGLAYNSIMMLSAVDNNLNWPQYSDLMRSVKDEFTQIINTFETEKGIRPESNDYVQSLLYGGQRTLTAKVGLDYFSKSEALQTMLKIK